LQIEHFFKKFKGGLRFICVLLIQGGAVSVNLKSDAKSPTNPTIDTRHPKTDTQQPTPDNQELTATSDMQRQPTLNNQHLTTDIRQPTTNNYRRQAHSTIKIDNNR
jgi:hypothetical protein